MRRDMPKVIVESGRRDAPARYGRSSVHRKGRPPRDHDDHPRHEGMRRPYSYDRKELTDHLKPLRRFLEKQVGRPWNTVYSEICENLRAGHALHDHLRQHVFDYVNVDNPRARNRRWEWNKPFYVDPRSAILRRHRPDRTNRQLRAERKAKVATSLPVVIDSENELHAVNGIWYLVQYARRIEPQRVVRTVYSRLAFEAERMRWTGSLIAERRADGGWDIIVPAAKRRYEKKRQPANGAMLRRYGLRNGVVAK